jgi:phenylalanine-4-hydroxylase
MPDLTTTRAAFIAEAQAAGELFIQQPYEHYSERNHDSWRRLYARMLPRWDRFANAAFRRGIASLSLDANAVPRLEDVNRFLCPLTGFQAKPVSGYVPAFLFFDCLRNREFPTTITIRDGDHLDYLPEPDIFHDIAGHVPMHTDRAFAEALVRFGECAHTAADLVDGIRDPQERSAAMTSIIRAMARFFWFTVEFGLMRSQAGLRVYGSGLLSSFGEIEHAVESPEVQRFPLQLEWVINQGFEIDHYQPLLFTVDSFDQLYELVRELENWMKEGRLSNVAPGEPAVNERDLESFLTRK